MRVSFFDRLLGTLLVAAVFHGALAPYAVHAQTSEEPTDPAASSERGRRRDARPAEQVSDTTGRRSGGEYEVVGDEESEAVGDAARPAPGARDTELREAPVTARVANAPQSSSAQSISLPTGEGSLQGMGESFSPQLSSGTATFSVPLSLPPGRNGVQPSLGLAYASTSGNGVVGIGWSLGVPFIARQTDRGTPRYVDAPSWHVEEDRFIYNGGQELVPVSNASIALVDRSGADVGYAVSVPPELATWQQYRAHVEGGFMRFFRSPTFDRWVVQSKDGTRFDFGLLPANVGPTDLDASPSLQRDANNASRVYAWYLTRMSDVHGSTVYYVYRQDHGAVYLADVYYVSPASCAGASTTAATRRDCTKPLTDYAMRVALQYESRPDVTSSYASGFRVALGERLRRVTVTAAEGAVGARFYVRRYWLTYGATYHSLLARVGVEGRRDVDLGGYFVSGEAERDTEAVMLTASLERPASSPYRALPDMTFEYSTMPTAGPQIAGLGGVDNTVHDVVNSPNVSAGNALAELFDVNGDGLVDMLVTDPIAYKMPDGAPAVGVFLNGFSGGGASVMPAGQTAAFSSAMPVRLASEDAMAMRLTNANLIAMDVDGDGRGDFNHVPPADPHAWFSPVRTVAGGDVRPSAQGWRFIRSDAPETATDPRIDLVNYGSRFRAVDVNNDHLVDIVRTAGDRMQTWFNLGWLEDGNGMFGQARLVNGVWALSTDPVETCLLNDQATVSFGGSDVRLGDMNGDGLTDIVRLSVGRVTYWPGRGGAVWGDGPTSCAPASLEGHNRHINMSPVPGDLNLTPETVHLVDVNMDGADDIVEVESLDISVWFNRGGASFSERIRVGAPRSSGTSQNVRFVDLDGSGTLDVVYGNATEWQYVDLAGGTRPRLLTRVHNGLGATTTLTYGSSTEDYVRDLAHAASATCSGADAANCARFTWDDLTDCDAALEAQRGVCVYRTGHSPVISTVLRATETTDNFAELDLTSNVVRTEYAYHDGYYEGIEQEFRGFGAADVRVVGDVTAPTSFTRTWFHQGRRPTEIAADRLADNPYEALKGRTYLSESFDELGRFLSSSFASLTVRDLLVGLDGRHVSYAFVHAQDDFTYDTSRMGESGPDVSLAFVRREQVAATGAIPTTSTDESETFRVRAARYMRTRKTTESVDNVGHVLAQTAHGRVHDEEDPPTTELVAYDEAITQNAVTTQVTDSESGWLFRTSSAHVRGHGDRGQQLGRTTSTFNALGDTIGVTQIAELPKPGPFVPAGGAYDFSGGGNYAQAEQTVRASTRFDAWGQPISVCAGAPPDADASACIRYGETQRDAAYAQLVEREGIAIAGGTVAGEAFELLETRGEWDRGTGTLMAAIDPNGVRASVTYDGLGRLTSTTPPNTARCASATPATIIRYTTRSAQGPPINIVETEVDARMPSGTDDCGAPLVSIARGYMDGLGRTRATLALLSGANDSWVRSGLSTYTAKGTPSCAFDADVLSGTAPLAAILEMPDTPMACVQADAFGRPLVATERDGSTSRVVYTASSQTAYDPLDRDQNTDLHHRDTPSTTRVDGHGRTIDQVLRLRQPGETYTHYLRLFTTYRADGAVTRVTRAETASDAPGATPIDTAHEVSRHFVYDSLKRRIGHTDPDSDNPADSRDATRHWRYLFNAVGDLAAVRDPRGCGEDFFYDRAGRLLAEDYVGCAEAQEAGDVADEQVPLGSFGLAPVSTVREADVRHFYDRLPYWAAGTAVGVPENAGRFARGRATGTTDRTQRSAVVYDARGQAIWAARQMALIPEAASLGTTTFSGALPSLPIETHATATRVWDEVNTYVSTSRYDHAGRALGIELPSDPDWALYGSGNEPPPVVGGAMRFDERGLPAEASLVINGVPSRLAAMTYDHFGQMTDTHIGPTAQENRLHVDYDVRHRPIQSRFSRKPQASSSDVLARMRYPFWYQYTWDTANNLVRVTDQGGYANNTFQAGYAQRTTHVTHDSLYRVAQVDFEYRGANGRWSPHDAATDWRAERTRTNADGRTHRDVDPMDREPAQMVPAMPAERVQNLTYTYDWLANMTEWTDDASAFYERSLGDIGNGAGQAGLRPSALYVATNIAHSEPAADANADRGGYVEVDYGAGGNVLAFTVHAQCRDASATNVCFADDPATTNPAVVRANLGARCVCNADTEQHVQLRWDELNRLVEARRYDRDTGTWELAVRQRHRYDAGNVRQVKETLDVDQTDPSLKQRIALSVIPGDFERVGVFADHDAIEPAYRGAAVLNTETQYAVAGARLVRTRGERAGVLNARHRLTYALSDLIQSTSAVIELDSGELLETTTFYPNGARETHRTTSTSSVPVEPVGFTGKEEDEEVGLTYFGERWLIPRIGRWASPDPLAVHALGGGEASNAYHYVSGNILATRDPLGLEGTILPDGRVQFQRPPGSDTPTHSTTPNPTPEQRADVENFVAMEWFSYGAHQVTRDAEAAWNKFKQMSPQEFLGQVVATLAPGERADPGLNTGTLAQLERMRQLVSLSLEDTYQGWQARGELYGIGIILLASRGFSRAVAPVLGHLAAGRGQAEAAEAPNPPRSTPDTPDANAPSGLCGPGGCGGEATCFIAGTLVETSEALVRIEHLRLGDRVASENEDCTFREFPSDAVTVHARMPINRSGSDVLRLEIVRSEEWLNSARTSPDRIWIGLPELGLRGWARVTYVGPPPASDPGSGCLVSATMNHYAERVLEIDTGAEILGVTPLHPLFVEHRGWVAAGELRVGDVLRAHHGIAEVLSVQAGSPQLVYNVEVDVDHIYRVGQSGVWAHNQCFVAPRLRTFDRLGIDTTEHFRVRVQGRAARGITERGALDAYRNGRLFYNPATGNYIRHSSRSRISVVVSEPSRGSAITVFEGAPSQSWVPVRWRPGM